MLEYITNNIIITYVPYLKQYGILKNSRILAFLPFFLKIEYPVNLELKH